MKYSHSKVACVVFFLCATGGGIYFWKHNTVRYFRETLNEVHPKRKHLPQCKVMNTKGLQELRAYGSAYLDMAHMSSLIQKNPDKFYVVSILPEQPQYFNGSIYRWYCLQPTPEGKLVDRKNNFFKQMVCKARRWYKGLPIEAQEIELSKFEREDEVLTKMGAKVLAPITGMFGHSWVNNTDYINHLVSFFEKLPKDANVYFHCSHGRGRTTTFLIIYDIFKNAHQVSLKDIIERQYCLGGENASDTVLWKKGTWSQEDLIKRKILINDFYSYMTDPEGYPKRQWSKWKKFRSVK